MFVGRDKELNKLRICTPNKVANGACLFMARRRKPWMLRRGCRCEVEFIGIE